MEIHHHVDGIRCIEAHQPLVFKTRNNARLSNNKINPICYRQTELLWHVRGISLLGL
jgi:hypothetical protein